MVAKRDTTERPHMPKTTRMIIQTVVAEGFVCEQNEAWEQLWVHTVLKKNYIWLMGQGMKMKYFLEREGVLQDEQG